MQRQIDEKRADNYWWCPHCREEILPQNVTFQEIHDSCGHRVHWIENISPDRLVEICNAERGGRLVVLPCKVGDPVYEPFAGKVYEKAVDKIIINRFTTPQIWIETAFPFATPRIERWDLAVGKTVFPTREEAEAALKEVDRERD